jgi:hypothetical protein
MQQWSVERRFFAVEQFLEITIPLLPLQLFEKHAFFLRHPVLVYNVFIGRVQRQLWHNFG